MLPSENSLTDHQLTLLDSLREAHRAASRNTPFVLRPIDRRPFVWVLHPGLRKGLMVGDLHDVEVLEDEGFVTITHDRVTAPLFGILLLPQEAVAAAYAFRSDPPLLPEIGNAAPRHGRGR